MKDSDLCAYSDLRHSECAHCKGIRLGDWEPESNRDYSAA